MRKSSSSFSFFLFVAFLVILSVCIAGCGSKVPPQIQKDNMSVAQKKLSSDLLQLTDDKFLPSSLTHLTLEQQMEKNHQLIYIDENGLATQNNNARHALVYVYIKTTENAYPNIINSYVWNITDKDPANGIIVAWVDVRKILELASLDGVQSLQTVVSPVSKR
jgi:hypothetical protein